MAYTREQIVALVRERDIRFIHLQFTDIFGQIKTVVITASQLGRALDNRCMFDGSSIEGFVRVNESDQYLYPDLDSFAVFPWTAGEGMVARLICDVYNPDGTPFIGDPRGVLRRALARAAAMGYDDFAVGPECEFFLFHTDADGKPTTRTNDEAGYFDLGPLDYGERTRRRICMTLEEMGFEIEASHHENAAGQHEIDFKYENALRAADNIMTFRQVVKTIARADGLHATFMPKPIFGVAGSGMHTNMSLHRAGQNAFFDPTDARGLSGDAYAFLAGLLHHVKGMAALTNPLVNSYKRLVPGYEAPCYIAWSASNRSALIRVPHTRGEGTRLELRSPDPACNPYLALAACLSAGLDGMERGMTPPAEIAEDIFEMTSAARRRHKIDSLPKSLDEAVAELKRDRVVLDALGPHVAAQYIAGKEREWQEYCTRVSSWEREKYIMNY